MAIAPIVKVTRKYFGAGPPQDIGQSPIATCRFPNVPLKILMVNQSLRCPVRSGIEIGTIEIGKPPGGGGFVLVQGERLRQIWGGNGEFFMSNAPSPDGCRLAFLSFAKRVFGETPRTVKIIDVCKGDQK